jgi:hypothetical protein
MPHDIILLVDIYWRDLAFITRNLMGSCIYDKISWISHPKCQLFIGQEIYEDSFIFHVIYFNKIKGIPREIKLYCLRKNEVRGFQGRLNYIARFISQLTTICDPIFQLLRKKNHGTSNEECKEAFNKIKQYLHNLPLLIPSISGRPLILYVILIEVVMECALG